jgi:hypothetical protein
VLTVSFHLHTGLPMVFSFRFSVQIFLHISHSHMYAIWHNHTSLLGLITLLHSIPNCYNVQNHV